MSEKIVISSNPEFYFDCKHCNTENTRGLLEFFDMSNGWPHYSRQTCYKCGKGDWKNKPDSDPSKYKRPAAHRELVKKYSPGYCEMCLKPEAKVTLHAHHVIEFKPGGSADRSNIWILCTACHAYVGHVRRYFNDPVSVKDMIEKVIASANLKAKQHERADHLF